MPNTSTLPSQEGGRIRHRLLGLALNLKADQKGGVAFHSSMTIPQTPTKGLHPDPLGVQKKFEETFLVFHYTGIVLSIP